MDPWLQVSITPQIREGLEHTARAHGERMLIAATARCTKNQQGGQRKSACSACVKAIPPNSYILGILWAFFQCSGFTLSSLREPLPWLLAFDDRMVERNPAVLIFIGQAQKITKAQKWITCIGGCKCCDRTRYEPWLPLPRVLGKPVESLIKSYRR